MDMSIIVVQKRKIELMERLINIWEKSVKSTHWFLSYNEINGIKKSVFYELQNVEHLLIAVNRKRLCVGFMGINQYKCDMLFIEPEECGKGLGKRFINWGIKNLDISEHITHFFSRYFSIKSKKFLSSFINSNFTGVN